MCISSNSKTKIENINSNKLYTNVLVYLYFSFLNVKLLFLIANVFDFPALAFALASVLNS